MDTVTMDTVPLQTATPVIHKPVGMEQPDDVTVDASIHPSNVSIAVSPLSTGRRRPDATATYVIRR